IRAGGSARIPTHGEYRNADCADFSGSAGIDEGMGEEKEEGQGKQLGADHSVKLTRSLTESSALRKLKPAGSLRHDDGALRQVGAYSGRVVPRARIQFDVSLSRRHASALLGKPRSARMRST